MVGQDKTEQQQAEQLYFRNFAFIIDQALGDSRLTQEDGQLIAEGVARHLQDYDGALTDDAFENWVTETIQPAVAFYGIKRECKGRVYDAIWKVLITSKSLGICNKDSADEIAQLVWLWAFENLDSLRDPTEPAKPSTRLYAKAYFAARAERTRRLRARERFATIDNFDQVGRDASGEVFIEPQNILAKAA